jgi:hypothetical protein
MLPSTIEEYLTTLDEVALSALSNECEQYYTSSTAPLNSTVRVLSQRYLGSNTHIGFVATCLAVWRHIARKGV